MTRSTPRIAPRSLIAFLGLAVLLGLGTLQAVCASMGMPVASNWFEFVMLRTTSAAVFCTFLVFYDGSYRVCWNEDALRVRLPGITWRLTQYAAKPEAIGGDQFWLDFTKKFYEARTTYIRARAKSAIHTTGSRVTPEYRYTMKILKGQGR